MILNSKYDANLEGEVYDALIQVGWKEERFLREPFISVKSSKKSWRPDFCYNLDDNRKIIIEVKSDLTKINQAWLDNINQILEKDQNYIFILTTGVYYEVHASGVSSSMKLLQAPTIDEILVWEKEVH